MASAPLSVQALASTRRISSGGWDQKDTTLAMTTGKPGRALISLALLSFVPKCLVTLAPTFARPRTSSPHGPTTKRAVARSTAKKVDAPRGLNPGRAPRQSSQTHKPVARQPNLLGRRAPRSPPDGSRIADEPVANDGPNVIHAAGRDSCVDSTRWSLARAWPGSAPGRRRCPGGRCP